MTTEAKDLGINKTCQNCLKRHASTYERKVYAKEYMGMCGDSFCAASCSMSTCFPSTMTICDDCHKILNHPPKARK
jgi:hypothetical protein